MVHGIIIATMLTLIGDNGSADHALAPPEPPSHPAQVSMQAADWAREDSHTPWVEATLSNWLYYHKHYSLDPHLSHPSPDPQGGWSLSLDFLGQRASAFLVTTASPVLTQGQYVKVVGGISVRGDVNVSLMPGGPVACSMYLQEDGDDPPPTENRYRYYRWWSKDVLALQGGRFVQVVRLEPQFWENVARDPGDKSAAATAGFQQALANPRSIGMWCRSGYLGRGGYVGEKMPDADDFRALLDPTFTIFSFAVCDEFADAPSAKQENEACAPPNFRSAP
jgi:hypothetical protein